MDRKTEYLMCNGSMVSVFEDQVEEFLVRAAYRRPTKDELNAYLKAEQIQPDSEPEGDQEQNPEGDSKEVSLAGDVIVNGSAGVGNPPSEPEPDVDTTEE